MSLPNSKLHRLLELVAETKEDLMDCDGCLEHIAHYAEVHLKGLTPREQLASVKLHLQSCPCCKDEFDHFMQALKTLELDAE